MKHYLSIFLLFFITTLFGQKGQVETDCSANAGGNDTICYTGNMCLSAPPNLLYAVPPNIQWTYLQGPLPDSQVDFVMSHALNTCVLNLSGSDTWPVGDYYFVFCVDCSNSGTLERPCDTTKITVMPEVTEPIILEMDGNEDGLMVVCNTATFNVNTLSLQNGEIYSIVPDPNDSYVLVTEVGGVVTATLPYNHPYECEYTIIYTTSNGGCILSDSVKVQFMTPSDNNQNGVIDGFIKNCPSCSRTVKLEGEFPGCGKNGAWSIIDGPAGYNVTFTDVNLEVGSAFATVDVVGHYTFVYDVTNTEPCPSSSDTIECIIMDIDSFDIGPNQYIYICDNILPADTYPHCFNYVDNAIYQWSASNSNVTISPDNRHCADLIVANDLTLPLTINVSAVKFYILPDCNDTLPPFELPLPFISPNETEAQVVQALNQKGICFERCRDDAKIYYSGSPVVEVKSNDIYFLCSNGIESIRLTDYFKVTNGQTAVANAHLIYQEPHCVELPSVFGAGQLLSLNVNNCGGCGRFDFQVDVFTYDYENNMPSPCTTSVIISIYIETVKQVTAGTDQVKCPGEPIRLNGNNLYCNAQGTWTQINCTNLDYYVVTIDSIHNQNTQIFIDVPNDSICPPDTLCFVWAFTSNEGNCDLSDTTRVIIRDSCCNFNPNCEERLHVATACVNDSLVLTVLNGANQPVDPSEFTVHWSPMNITGNPVAFPYSTPVHYTVEIFKIAQSDTFCYTVLSGLAECAPECVWPEGCNIRVEESCDSTGDVVLTLYDVLTNTVIVPVSFEYEIFWHVYEGGDDDDSYYSETDENPITIQQDACYSLKVNRRFFTPGGQPLSLCTFELPKTCPCVECVGPCSDFNDFFVAGCGDTLDINLNLQFDGNCQNVCNPTGSSVTLGVFHADGTPVTGPQFHILWENNTTGTYATANLYLINTVTITRVIDGDTCEWHAGYTPNCPCTVAPTNLHCEQPITKYCRPDGSFYFVAGAPQIVWSPVPGATGYIYEIMTGNIPGCCNRPVGILSDTVFTTFYDIPANLPCFRFRVRALIPYCENTPWSEYYTYCPQQIVCTPVITVCGCCHGERSGAETGFETRVVSEEEMLAFLNAHPGTEYPTLQEALNAAGVVATTEPEFAVYPNPANDKLLIQSGSTVSGNFKVQLTDLLNREWRNVNIVADGLNTLNITDLPVGVYLITIKNAHGDRMLTQKVTVIR